MAQQVVRAQVVLKPKSSTMLHPTMDFIFEQLGTSTNLVLSGVADILNTFFTGTVTGQTNSLDKYISATIQRNPIPGVLRMYDITAHLDASASGPPIYEEDFYLIHSPGAPQPLPEEVACCISYQSLYGTDPEFAPGARPRATHRGRVYIGPLDASVTATGPNAEFAFATAFLNDLEAAFNNMIQLETGGVADVPSIVQWSRKMARVLPIADTWMNNAADTRRRRGAQPTSVVTRSGESLSGRHRPVL